MVKGETKGYGIGIKTRLLGLAASNGYTDINDYIDALNVSIGKLQAQNKALQEELVKERMKKDQPEIDKILKAAP